jgi:hypothetical protein
MWPLGNAIDPTPPSFICCAAPANVTPAGWHVIAVFSGTTQSLSCLNRRRAYLPHTERAMAPFEFTLARGFFLSQWWCHAKNDHHLGRFDLTRSGRFSRLDHVITSLNRERFSARPASKTTIDRSDQNRPPEPLDKPHRHVVAHSRAATTARKWIDHRLSRAKA